MNCTELLGWVGSVVFSLSAFPQALKSWQDKHSRGLAPMFLVSWFIGCSTMFAYATLKGNMLPLQCNYAVNFAFLLVIIWYKLFPKN